MRELWFIAGQAELESLCRELGAARRIAIDTEFERQRTYFAELCLVQISAADVVACIDPYAVSSLAPLSTALAAPAATKILHAARQDLEILYQTSGCLPVPLFDTQVAAGLAGFADNIGYADLVQQVLGVVLDKSQTRTDWRQRPLTDAQLRYAADDVRYLDELAARLHERLCALGREAWLDEESRALAAPATYDQPAASAWQRVKGLAALPAPAFARAVALAAWREDMARRRNLPRGWVVRDDELIDIAVLAPADTRALGASTLSEAAVRRYGEAILETLARPLPAVEQPAQRRLTAAGRRLLKAIGQRAQEIAGELNVAVSLLVTRRELEACICGQVPARLSAGWRQAVLRDVVALAAAGAGEPVCQE